MWENLKESGCPELRDDVELEFRLALLDYYIRVSGKVRSAFVEWDGIAFF